MADLLTILCVMFSCVTLPCGILGQVWYLYRFQIFAFFSSDDKALHVLIVPEIAPLRVQTSNDIALPKPTASESNYIESPDFQ